MLGCQSENSLEDSEIAGVSLTVIMKVQQLRKFTDHFDKKTTPEFVGIQVINDDDPS